MKQAARVEFEASREEIDPVKIAQLLLTSRQALDECKRRVRSRQYNEAQWDLVKRIQAERTDVHNRDR